LPYIRQDDRYPLDDLIAKLPVGLLDEGMLNYLITRIILKWLGADGSYASYNSAIGLLESIKLELYRRKVAPYEDTKRIKRGDVY
jgi:hypothetical protein